MKKLEFVIDGEVVAKGRPRVTKGGWAYTPKKTKDYEKLVKDTFRSKFKDMKALEGPLKIKIDCYMYIPKNTSNIRRERKNAKEILPTKAPDWDNMAKSITDGLNKLAYEDDKYIVDARVRKFFSDDQRAEVTIWEVEGEGI